jgi:hypothetical protein
MIEESNRLIARLLRYELHWRLCDGWTEADAEWVAGTMSAIVKTKRSILEAGV